MQTIPATGLKPGAHRPRKDLPAAWLILGLALSLGCAGCVPLMVGAAGGAAGAVYVLGKLEEEVKDPVPTVHQAAVLGLKDLDLPIKEDKVDKLTGRLESEFADGSHVWIDLDTLSESRTRITIRVGVMGDEVRSRRILQAITTHLPASHTS